MDKPKSLDNLFEKKIFRIPDYQRGYAWQKSQLKDFWEDLVNLADNRSHYTGVLTLKEVKSDEIDVSDNEYWLVEDYSYKIYHIVDGQQRLTTFVIFLQALIDVVKQISDADKDKKEIYITDTLSLETVISRYLFQAKPPNNLYRTYKFGYTIDNPSYDYLKYKIFNESGTGSIKETFYTLNLKNAKQYFYEQLKSLYSDNGMKGLQKVYKKLTKKFLFNEYIIEDEFDVFVAFETMNNRGKKLSDLELLKNRLIYLTTLYSDDELDPAGRRSLRDEINNAWKEVYHQLGRNEKRPLNDDDFLKAHWIMYFKYSKKRGNDYINFLLDEQFSPQKVHKKIEHEVILDLPEEQRTDLEADETENNDLEEPSAMKIVSLRPQEIKEYVNSLKESAVHWFNSYYPYLSTSLTDEERHALDRLNRVGIGYFRPLVMSILKNEKDAEKRIELFDAIERFIFIVFRLCQSRSNYRNSEFYNAARELNQGTLKLEDIKSKLDNSALFCFDEDGKFDSKYFYDYLYKRFKNEEKSGYYGWSGLRYFLYEYELKLLSHGVAKKVTWDDLLRTPKDKISIEHIFPQKPTEDWKQSFSSVAEENYYYYSGSLGNLLLLSMSINSALQNHSFNEKKNPKYNNLGEKTRNGYSNGSHSEIEVSQNEDWNPKTIKVRGIKLLTFMEERWRIKFKEGIKEELLFLPD
ncbi:hypothetical protein AWQ21_15030 (plasmid) [Picosynechococcus sp. PCC 7003]|uniref:GmrSD restriction endonuclease domain-containing protein n=1 Tax=Picosynechococcus sp. PCC 7003 TaxID=374981 RepID=UPI0008109D51|nr:DUF262 domain-containing protein [Picosynechococcus sp. PCC 7003]ANV85843.1 hypothetical protein AWQ21_15030 [Picosynechococcus sp. PCC 7003]